MQALMTEYNADRVASMVEKASIYIYIYIYIYVCICISRCRYIYMYMYTQTTIAVAMLTINDLYEAFARLTRD